MRTRLPTRAVACNGHLKSKHVIRALMYSYTSACGVALVLSLASGLAQGACDALKPFSGQSTAPSREQEIDHGRQAFESNCAVCHGMDASGGRGPNLRRPRAVRVRLEVIGHLRL
jgi:mono/diheme cytochrome c family protein